MHLTDMPLALPSRYRWILALAAIVLATSAGRVEAQITPAESAAVLLQAAEQFEREGRWDVAEAIYVLITERYPSTPSAAEAALRLRAPASDRPEPMSRIELQVFGTGYGAWLGIAVPLAFGADSPEAYGAGFLVGAPLGLLASRAFLNRNPVTEGQARAISWGGVWGSWQGFGWTKVLDIGQEEICTQFGCYPNEDDTEEVVAAMVVGGLLGITGGALLAREPISSGVASAAQGGAMWASIYGAMIAGMFDEGENAVLTTTLLAGNVGLVTGAILANKYDVSRGRVRMINLGAFVGGLAGVGLDLLIQPDDEDIALLIPLATSVLGLGIAVSQTSDEIGPRGDPDASAALLDYSAGALRLGPPIPRPALLRVERPDAPTTRTPGFTLELFRARF